MAVPTGAFELHPPSLREILLGGGPRIARDAFGPPLAFYLGWKAVGLVAGIALATAVSLLALRAARGAGRSGVMARLALVLVLVQAVVGLVSGSERVYLAQPVVINAVLGLWFLGSVALGRPFAASFADELYAFPDEVRESATFRQAFGRISLAWGVYLCARSVFRLVMLASTSVEAFLLVNLLTGSPLMALMLAWSIWYAVRFFRNSEEWGPAIQALEQAQLEGQL